jgi:hypothetical protein
VHITEKNLALAFLVEPGRDDLPHLLHGERLSIGSLINAQDEELVELLGALEFGFGERDGRYVLGLEFNAECFLDGLWAESAVRAQDLQGFLEAILPVAPLLGSFLGFADSQYLLSDVFQPLVVAPVDHSHLLLGDGPEGRPLGKAGIPEDLVALGDEIVNVGPGPWREILVAGGMGWEFGHTGAEIFKVESSKLQEK